MSTSQVVQSRTPWRVEKSRKEAAKNEKNHALLAALIVAALILTACGSPSAGSQVEIGSGAIGCRTWFDAAESWVDCDLAGGYSGVVEDHPKDESLGHEYQGRVRVQVEAFGPLWFEPGDLLTRAP